MRHWKRILLLLVACGAAAVLLCVGLIGPCWSAWWSYGVLVGECPTGVLPYVRLETNAVGRGVKGTVRVSVTGQLYNAQLQAFDTRPVRRFTPQISLITPDGTETKLSPERGWDNVWEGTQQGQFFLPKDAPDGDYVLRANVSAPSGDFSYDLALPLFRPALEHTLTDAPLYRAGQVVKARSVLLDAGTLAPLPGRPGKWQVLSPEGDLVMEERGSTGGFGVASTTFPLAPDAPAGNWTIQFVSGQAQTAAVFEVREYRLPRFTVELDAEKPWYAEGEAPHIEGVARYSSGAPVQRAPVRAQLYASGPWDPPRAWTEPFVLTTDAEGKFVLNFPATPEDLVGDARLSLTATVTDETGESAAGNAELLLSEDPIHVDAVTELEGGLVADANNRMYLRVTTPDGAPVVGKKVHLRREWDSRDPGLDATTDEDAVAKFQLDPGQAVTVTEPAYPVRPAESADPVVVSGISDAVGGESDLALQQLSDDLERAWRPCARLVNGSASGNVWARATPGGVAELWVDEGSLAAPIAECLGIASSGVPLRGPTRAVQLSVSLTDPGSPHLSASTSTFVGDATGLDESLSDVATRASSCLRTDTVGGEVPGAWMWSVDKGGLAPRFARVTSEGDNALASVSSCLERFLPAARLSDAATVDAAGSVQFSASGVHAQGDGRTSPPSWPGFSFVASIDGIGDTVMRMPVGVVPPLRLRLSEVVTTQGAEIELTAIRGPDWSGSFPDHLQLMQGDRLVARFPFDKHKRNGKFVVPNDVQGFMSVEWYGARAVLYVQPQQSLSVALTSTETWKPGNPASLTVTTTDHGRPVPAGVTLSGVDSTLAALVALPQPDDWARVTVLATSASPAFGMLDARALQTGQVVGTNAAQATVLRISTLPPSQPGSDNVSTSGESVADVESPLSDAYYGLYANVKKAVRAWEKSAPEGELMTAEHMVKIWEATLSDHPATDPFGRPLHLSYLPSNLRDLADPRMIVADAKRLPEDVENWTLYVVTEAP